MAHMAHPVCPEEPYEPYGHERDCPSYPFRRVSGGARRRPAQSARQVRLRKMQQWLDEPTPGESKTHTSSPHQG